jgi:hypothetical protein
LRLLDADTFVWASHEDLLNPAGGGADLIWDFQDGTDKFDLRSISGGFSLVGYTTEGADGFVQIDLGYDRFDGLADAAIKLVNGARFTISQSDFV